MTVTCFTREYGSKLMAQPGNLLTEIILQESGSHVFKETFSLEASEKWCQRAELLMSTFFLMMQTHCLSLYQEHFLVDYLGLNQALSCQNSDRGALHPRLSKPSLCLFSSGLPVPNRTAINSISAQPLNLNIIKNQKQILWENRQIFSVREPIFKDISPRVSFLTLAAKAILRTHY